MQQYERDTWYDIHGRIVFTNSKGLVGIGLPREGTRKEPLTVITYPDGKVVKGNHGWKTSRTPPKAPSSNKPSSATAPTRKPAATNPFTLAYREADYCIAWAYFVSQT